MSGSKERRWLVLCSSLAASGPSSPGHSRSEEDPLDPRDWYGESKAEAERIAASFTGAIGQSFFAAVGWPTTRIH